MKARHLGEINNMDEDCFVSPAVSTIKNDKTMKHVLNCGNLNESYVKRQKLFAITTLKNSVYYKLNIKTFHGLDDIATIGGEHLAKYLKNAHWLS